MASHLHSLSGEKQFSLSNAEKLVIGLVVSDYNKEITHAMRDACLDTLVRYGIRSENIHLQSVPGAFELPLAAYWLQQQKLCDAVICIGCVIKGETDHDVYINHSVATALQKLSLQLSKPFVFGVLTPNTHQQATDRAGGKHGNKGIECALTALHMLSIKNS